MKQAILTVGISASGKSTWAKDFMAHNPHWRHLNRDTIRAEIISLKHNVPVLDYVRWDLWQNKWEKRVTEEFNNRLTDTIAIGQNILISDTNLNKDRRDKLVTMLTSVGYSVKLEVFNITYDEAIKRDASRLGGVGHSVIRKQWKQWLEQVHLFQTKPPLKYEEGAFPCVLFDIDGTVAHMGNRNPFDWNKVGEDKPDIMMVILINALVKLTIEPIFLSGRDEVCYEATRKWLTDAIPALKTVDFKLFMRPAGSTEKDTIVKQRIFAEHINGNYDVLCVFDDRPSVVRMWHDLGLKVWATGDQNIEF